MNENDEIKKLLENMETQRRLNSMSFGEKLALSTIKLAITFVIYYILLFILTLVLIGLGLYVSISPLETFRVIALSTVFYMVVKQLIRDIIR